jgi:hypothetical protein
MVKIDLGYAYVPDLALRSKLGERARRDECFGARDIGGIDEIREIGRSPRFNEGTAGSERPIPSAPFRPIPVPPRHTDPAAPPLEGQSVRRQLARHGTLP